MLGIGSAEHSWGDVKKTKSEKISALGSEISEKHSIVYTSDFIEEAIIEKLYQTPIAMTVHTVTHVMTRIMPFVIN